MLQQHLEHGRIAGEVRGRRSQRALRSSHDVADPASALGERRARGAYDQARSDIDAAKARRARDRDLERARRARSARSHGLGR
jgi:hypothetical protein